MSTSYFVADDLADRSEVARSAAGRGGVAELAPHQHEHRAQDRCGEQEAEPTLLAEQSERHPDEQANPQAGNGPASATLPRVRRPVTRSTDFSSVPTISTFCTANS